MKNRMDFENLTENPQEVTVALTSLGLLIAQELKAVDIDLLGRMLIYLGEVLTVISVLMLTQEANEDKDRIEKMIYELQKQNQYLQKQIWDLQNKG